MRQTAVDDAPAHACVVPVSDEHLWEVTAAFLAGGLRADEQVLFFDDGASAGAVLERLADDRVPTRGPLTRGQLAIVDSAVTRAAQTGPADAVGVAVAERIDESVAAGYAGLRLTGPMVFTFARAGVPGLVEYDAAVDLALRGRPGRMLCTYDVRRFSAEAVERMREVHEHEVVTTAFYDDGLLRITRDGPGRARLAGEVDHSNRPMVARLLAVLLDEAFRSPAAPEEIVLDVASLRFLDVAGAVTLLRAADAFPGGQRLVLDGARRQVVRLLERCGAPFAARLAVRPRTDPDGEQR